jgi:regulator of protease activity HflC (stomatin/prohibitin superfamily)
VILTVLWIVLAVMLVLGLTLGSASVRVLREYERGVVFRLGRLIELKGPGVVLLIPFLDRLVRVSLRTVTLQVPPQEVITRDNVPARVTAVAYFRVVDPNKSIVEIQDVLSATSQIAQTTLRSVLGKAELDTLLSEREQLNENLQHIIDDQTEPWGVKVTTVEIKDVEIPEQMQHAMARQAEAERERRAKIIDAEGEFQAAAKLLQAADLISRNPVTIQLRYLQTLREIGGNENSTIVFPFPLDLLQQLRNVVNSDDRAGAMPASSPDPQMPTIASNEPSALSPTTEQGSLEHDPDGDHELLESGGDDHEGAEDLAAPGDDVEPRHGVDDGVRGIRHSPGAE